MCVCSGDTWLAECILDNSSPELTWLDLHTDDHSDHIIHQLQRLHNLHELAIHDFDFHGKSFANSLGDPAEFRCLTVCLFFPLHVYSVPCFARRPCRQLLMLLPSLSPFSGILTLQALTALHLDFVTSRARSEFAWEKEQTFAYSLVTLRDLRRLTFEHLNGVSGSVMAGVLQVPKLEHLHVISMLEWKWSATTIGLLSAKAAAQWPGLRITFDQSEMATVGPGD